MKAIVLAVAVIVVVIGAFAYIVHRAPNRAQTEDAFAVLHGASTGVPNDPAALGYLHLKKRQSDELEKLSVEAALKEKQSSVVEGTILKQEYLLRQAEYKLAQLKRVGGDISLEEFEIKRLSYADATKNFQVFWDTKLSTK